MPENQAAPGMRDDQVSSKAYWQHLGLCSDVFCSPHITVGGQKLLANCAQTSSVSRVPVASTVRYVLGSPLGLKGGGHSTMEPCNEYLWKEGKKGRREEEEGKPSIFLTVYR